MLICGMLRVIIAEILSFGRFSFVKAHPFWPGRSNGASGSRSGLLALARHNDFGVCALRGKFCFYGIFG